MVLQVNSLTEARCLKCKTTKNMKEPKPLTMKNGRNAVSGKCPDCGTKMFRILPNKK